MELIDKMKKETSLSPDERVTITVDGKQIDVPAGISVASAVLGHAHESKTSVHPISGDARAPYCLMGVCFECMIEIDGESDVQSCLINVHDGMIIKCQSTQDKA